jgi:spore coat protein U-like protein
MRRLATHWGLALLAMVLLWYPGHAQAATTCTATTTPLSFGPVTGESTVDATASVTVTCQTTGLSLLSTIRVRMCLNIGAGAQGGGQLMPRRMTNAEGDVLQFQIYKDEARTQIWGANPSPAAPASPQRDLEYSILALSNSGSITATLYGRIPVQTALAAGAYSNSFSGIDARLIYRYAEPILGTPAFPTDCTTGGTNGGETTFPFTATANVPNRCTISTATDLDFGSVPGLIASAQDQTSSITLNCTRRTPWHLALDDGQHAAGGTRRMHLGGTGNYVAYDLFRDSARSQRWGATTGSDTVPGTGSGGAQTLTVYGRVPAPQSVPAGQYRDTVRVTVTY